MTGQDVQAALSAALDMLDEQRIEYALMGALSLSFYGRGRATNDVDVMIAGGRECLDRIRRIAPSRGFSIDDLWIDQNPGIRDTHIRLIHGAVPVDIMLPRDAQDTEAFARRRSHAAASRTVSVISPEDIILQKIKAGRPHDFDDAISFFTRHRDMLDHDYLNQWARRLGVREELDYLWSQSDQVTQT